ncbi:MAG: hypothetical protein QOJ26_1612 [Thermoplasmata archaeon]|nr:hypothetical protein [Thermoplasmata archaeon]
MAVAAVMATALLAGCGTPSAGAEPDRPSVMLPPRVVEGERLDGNATVLVSGMPEEAAAILSPDRPMNCFQIETDTGERTYLGGAVLELTWTAASSVTENLTVTASNFPQGSWRASGTSPLRLNPVASDEETVELPMLVEVAPTGADALDLGADQEVHLHVIVGLLESLIEALAVKQASCP